MLGTQEVVAGFQQPFEFIPKSKADCDLFCVTEGGEAATAFKLEAGSSPEILVAGAMPSDFPNNSNPEDVPHVVRMRILGLTGILVNETPPCEVDQSPPPPPPKYLKSVVAVTQDYVLHGISPLSKRLVRASNERNPDSNLHQRHIAVWDGCNNKHTETNSVLFEANLPDRGNEDEQHLPRRCGGREKNYELVVGLTPTKKKKPTAVGVVGLPLEEAAQLRSKSGKIVLDLPVFNFTYLSSDPFAAPMDIKQSMIRRRTFSTASSAHVQTAGPRIMEERVFDQRHKNAALGYDCLMDPAKDAAVLRIELDIQRKPTLEEGGSTIDDSAVLVQPTLHAIEMAHSAAENDVMELISVGSAYERIPLTSGHPPLHSAQYRVRVVDPTTNDCALSPVKLLPEDSRVSIVSPDKEQGSVTGSVIISTNEHQDDEIEHTLEERNTPAKPPKIRGVFSLLHAGKKLRGQDPGKPEDLHAPSIEKSSVASVEQATQDSSSENEADARRLIESVKVSPSITRAPATVSPVRQIHEEENSFRVYQESREDLSASIEPGQDEATSYTFESMKRSLRPYTSSFDALLEEEEDFSVEDSWTQEMSEQEKEGDFDEFMGVFRDFCRPFTDDNADSSSVSFRRKPNWVSAILDESLSVSCQSNNTSMRTDDTNHINNDAEIVQEEGEEIDMNQIAPIRSSSKKWPTLSRPRIPRPPMSQSFNRRMTRITSNVEVRPKPSGGNSDRECGFSERSPAPNLPSVSIKVMSQNDNNEHTENYSKPLAEFDTSMLQSSASLPDRLPPSSPMCFANSVVNVVSNAFTHSTITERTAELPPKPLENHPSEEGGTRNATPNALVTNREVARAASPLCFNSVVDVVSNAFTPTQGAEEETAGLPPTPQKKHAAEPSPKKLHVNYSEEEKEPPIPNVYVANRDMASIGDLTATSHEMQVDIEEFKMLIKKHLKNAKKTTKRAKLPSFMDDAEMYAGVDDSWLSEV